MRILFLTQWFAPEPHFKGLPFAIELQRRGHEVVVLTGFPNYPGGKLYPGYQIHLWQWETLEGVRILRVPLFPSHDQGALGRIFNYLSFALSAAVVGSIGIGKVDVAYVYHPPATVGLPALVFQWIRRVPCVYDVQDLWPDTLAATGMVRSRLLLVLAGFWSNFVYRRMAHVVVLSRGFRERLLARRVRPEKVSTILNWSPDYDPNQAKVTLPASEARLLAGRFNLVFAGNMGAAQGLDALLDAAAILSESHPQIQFVMVGGGVDSRRLKDKTMEMKLNNVLFLPRRNASEVQAVLAAADVLLVHLKDEPLFEITIPSKTQTYLAAGKPILMAVRGNAAELIEQSGAGICCTPENASDLSDGVRLLFAMPAQERQAMGVAGRRYYEERLDVRHGVSAFEKIFVTLGSGVAA